MNVWLVTIGEPVPTDSANERLLRAGILAGRLVKQGHRVTWWTSTLNHVTKTQRFDRDTFVDWAPEYRLVFLHAPAYRNNISVNRIRNHLGIARKFQQLAPREMAPDVILCSMPTVELSRAVVEYGKRFRVPTILDMRDLWPDIFVDVFPGLLRGLASLALYPAHRSLRLACRGATAITGITPPFVNWGLSRAGRKATVLDQAFHLGYDERVPSPNATEKAEAFWHEQGIDPDPELFTLCFFGSLGQQFELETVIAAAQQLENERPGRFRFVLCGAGDRLAEFQALARGCGSIRLPGWVGQAEIWTLLRRSDAGLAPYRSDRGFTDSLPNKAIEYLSAGLPVLSSLTGYLETFLLTHACGQTYHNNDVQGLVRLVQSLAADPAGRARMAENARHIYEQELSADKVYGAMIDYLARVAANGPERPGSV